VNAAEARAYMDRWKLVAEREREELARSQREVAMSAFVVGVPVPEGLDARVYRVRVVVDRVDGAALSSEDLARIEAVYPSKPARPRATAAETPSARKAKTARKPRRAA
jgi:hypothetical protein